MMHHLRLLSPRRTPAAFMLHLSMAVILAGALLTHFLGVEGRLHLSCGEAPVSEFELVSGPGQATMPFGVELVEPVIDCYPGTNTPMDFASLLRISFPGGGKTLAESRTAVNKVMEYDGWRFYQSGISADSSTLVISHDPVGTAVTYAGYLMAVVAMILFLFQKRSLWRDSLRKVVTPVLLWGCVFAAQASAPQTIQRPLAASLGKMYILWNGRVCPLQTMARDVTIRLYGCDSPYGYTPEQVIAGWLFYFDDWMDDLREADPSEQKLSLARWIGSGSAVTIYPYQTARGTVEWLSLSERRPSMMPLEQWVFIQEAMPRVASLVRRGRNVEANTQIGLIIEGQRRYAPPGVLPGERAMALERFYNSHIRLRPLTFILLALSLWGFFMVAAGRCRRLCGVTLLIGALAGLIYIGVALAVRSYVGGHLPFANGHETMLSLAVVACAVAVIAGRDPLLRPGLLLVGALASLVAVMGEKNPPIASLMPVLASPWLSVHVMLVILSYAAFTLMAILSAVALVSRSETLGRRCAALCRVILLPGVFLLGAGIMAGAVWANQSWGRYWGWDPKETCALVTLLVYAIPLHRVSFPLFSRDRALCVYLLMAIGAVLFTYFGANYLLPGLHSYA